MAALAAPPAGVVTTVAGTPGMPGYADGAASEAMVTHPTWLDVVVSNPPPAFDEPANGEIFVVDRMNQRVRRVSDRGFVSTFSLKRGLGPTQTSVSLDFDSAFGGGVMVEPPNSGCGGSIYNRGVFLVATGDQQVVLASMSGDLASRDLYPVIVGTGNAGDRDGYAVREAEFRAPVGIARSWQYRNDLGPIVYLQSLYIADSGNHT